MSQKPTVLVLYVGGTIGMVRTPGGYVPRAGFLERYVERMPEMAGAQVPDFSIQRIEPLLDSSDMGPDDWVRIAAAVRTAYDDYDGFVVLHGTDTMAYTASALSFLLPGLAKPVILTGAQLSLEDVRSDGREHVITSLIIAGTLPVPEVCIYFGAKLLRGNRAQKVNNHDFVAFESGNAPPLGKVGVRIQLARESIRRPRESWSRPIELRRKPHVVALRLFPGMTPEVLAKMLATPVDGVVLETYGAGNFPAGIPAMLQVLRAALERADAPVVVNCSQCHGGSVRQSLYSTGAALARLGVVSGLDMTPEAALTKLYVLLAQGLSHAEVRRKMTADLAGELNPDLEETEAPPPQG